MAIESMVGNEIADPILWTVRDSNRTQGSPRRHLVTGIFVVYFLAILEGAVRKWIWPEWGMWLFFIRDPIVLYLYAYATAHRLWPRASFVMILGGCFAVVGALVALADLALADFSLSRLPLLIYGWRNYFLYPPLAFLIARNFSRLDLDRLFKYTLLLAIPIAILVTAQFWAPIDAAINVGVAEDTALQFRGLVLNGDHTRAMGTFTSITGQVLFVSSSLAISFALLFLPAGKRPGGPLLVTCGMAASLTSMALSGSRFIFLHAAVTLVSAIVFALLTSNGRQRYRALVIPVVVALTGALLYPIVFPSGFEAFSQRWVEAQTIESQQFEGGVVGRALSNFTDFTQLLNSTPILGYGLGLGGNAGLRLGATIQGVLPPYLAETDWARQIVDLGPIFGMAYIFFRIWLVLWIGVMVVRASRAGRGPYPMLLFGFLAPELLVGQITGHGTVNVYGWISCGLCLASCVGHASLGPQPRAGTTRERYSHARRSGSSV